LTGDYFEGVGRKGSLAHQPQQILNKQGGKPYQIGRASLATVTILGAGAWGTALAVVLARNGHAVTLAVRRHAQLVALQRERKNQIYLPGVEFPPDLKLAELDPNSIKKSDALIVAIPSAFARGTLSPMLSLAPAGTIVISVSKGIEQESLRTMSQILTEIAPPAERIAVLSGPGFAAEVASGKPAALVAAADNEALAGRVQMLLAAKPLRVYRSLDVVGVELGGASKNVIAIAAGISDGLALGSGARAALITRGLAEMMRLAEASGAKRETLAGLAGFGDLVLTCTGDLSRNRQLGQILGRGGRPPIPAEGEAIAEGVPTVQAIVTLAGRLGVQMPIMSAVYRVLYEAAPAGAMVDELLSRELKAEF
jgi:glycerol-3-phosphate dehydrogenase (NAD(P)+)